MADYEIERERIVEREPHGRRIVVERGGAPAVWAGGYLAPVIMAAVVILLLLLVLGAFT